MSRAIVFAGYQRREIRRLPRNSTPKTRIASILLAGFPCSFFLGFQNVRLGSVCPRQSLVSLCLRTAPCAQPCPPAYGRTWFPLPCYPSLAGAVSFDAG